MTYVLEANLPAIVGYFLIALGLAGVVLPVVPGPLLIWLGTLVWAWGDGFARVGWVDLALLGFLALLAWGADLWLAMLVSRRAGVSWKAIAGAMVCGTAGGILLVQSPIVGVIFGALLGAMLGMLAIEWYDKRSLRVALRAMGGYWVGSLAASAFEIVIAFVMVWLFFWQAWS